MILLLSALALAHGPSDCPPVQNLLGMAYKGAIAEPLQKCLEGGELSSPEGRMRRWAAWRHGLWTAGWTPELSDELDALLATTTSAERALEAGEALATDHADAAARPRARAHELLAASPWSVIWVGNRDRLAALDKSLGAPNAPLPAPGVPTAAQLAQCRDLGRLWSRAIFGGVYATDRDCVVRLAGVLEGDARDRSCELALVLAARHPDAEQGRLVAQRVAELQLR